MNSDTEKNSLPVDFLQNEEIPELCGKLLKNAKNELIIVQPWFEPTPHLLDNLKEALKGKVKVVIITRKEQTRKRAKHLETLLNTDGELEIFGFNNADTPLHAKMIICDGRDVLVTSMNFLEGSTSKNYEVGIHVVNDAGPINELIFRNVAGLETNFMIGIQKYYHRLRDNSIRIKKIDELTIICEDCSKPTGRPNYYKCTPCYNKSDKSIR